MNENVLEIRIEDKSPPAKSEPAGRGAASQPVAPLMPPVPPPTPTRPQPPAAGPGDDGAWHKRYRELRNRTDSGGTVTGDETAELGGLEQRLRDDSKPKAQPSTGPSEPVPTPVATPTRPPAAWNPYPRYHELNGADDHTAADQAEFQALRQSMLAAGKPVGPPRPPKPLRPDAPPEPAAADLRPNPDLDALFNGTPPPPRPPSPPAGPPEPPPEDDRSAKLMAQARERNARDRDARRLNAEAERDRVADEKAKRRDAEGDNRGATPDELRGLKGLTGPPKPPEGAAGGFDFQSLLKLGGKGGGLGDLAGLAGKAGGLLGGAGGAAGAAGGGLAAGLGGAAMAAAGPVGLAVAAGAAVTEVTKKVFGRAEEGIDALGAAAKDVAGNDGMGLLKKGTDGVASAFDSIGPAGALAAAEWRLAGKAIGTFQEVVGAFVARGKELAAYDARLAGANAAADVRSLQRDIKEAEATGAALAKLTDAQSRLDANFSEALLPVKELLAEVLVNLIEPLAAASDFYIAMKPMMAPIKSVLQGMEAANVPKMALMAAAELFFDSIKGAAAKAEQVADFILDPLGLRTNDQAAAKAAEEVKLNKIMQNILDVGENLGPINGGGSGRRSATADRVGLPLLQ